MSSAARTGGFLFRAATLPGFLKGWFYDKVMSTRPCFHVLSVTGLLPAGAHEAQRGEIERRQLMIIIRIRTARRLPGLFMFSVLLLFLVLHISGTSLAEEGSGSLRINEVMAANRLTAVEGRSCDWIELYNAGDTDLPLDGWGLSDNAALPYRGKLSGTLAPGGYLVIAADEEGLGFSLKREQGRITLTSPSGETADEVSYENMPWDVSLIREGTGWRQTWLPTPGKQNEMMSRDGREARQFLIAQERGVILSEVMAANGTYGADMLRYDWVELQNPTDRPVVLGGLYLSDDAGDLKKWAFPRNAILRANTLAVVYCTDDPAPRPEKGKYFNDAFKIDKTGGAVILSDGNSIIDCVSLGTQHANVSFGRPEGQGAFRFLDVITFLKPNPSSGCSQRLPPVGFSQSGGMASAPFTLSLAVPDNGIVHYTLDGTEPTEASEIYKEPLLIWQNTVVRAFSRRDGWISSPVATQTYLFDQPPKHPVVCVTGDPAFFFGNMGFFVKGSPKFVGERPVNVEIYEDGTAQVNQQAGLRLTGGTSRIYLPRTFSLYARAGLGESSFRYNPFPDRYYGEYSCLTLRSGGTDILWTHMRDGFLSHLAQGYGLMYLAFRPALVYVNGQFWGAMNLRERANRDTIAQWEGITDPDAIDGIIIIKNRGEEVHGSRMDLEELAGYCRKNDLNDPECLRYVLDRLDINSLFAHTAFEMISGNTDLQNVRYYKVPGGKWKLMLFDLDMSMQDTNDKALLFYLDTGKTATKYCYGELFTSLMQVPLMRDRFLSLTGRILAECFTALEITTKLDEWQADYAPLMRLHAQRWMWRSFEHWENTMGVFRTMLAKRPAFVTEYIIRRYQLSEAETERYFGAFLKANAEGQTP